MEINVFYNDVRRFYKLKKLFIEISTWIISRLDLSIKSLNIIFVSDQFLKNMHHDYFNLDTITDVITFNLNETNENIEGEIYISVDRAQKQSEEYKVQVQTELCRLIIHGCLHLSGYEDNTKLNQQKMKKIENHLVESATDLFLNKLHVEET